MNRSKYPGKPIVTKVKVTIGGRQSPLVEKLDDYGVVYGIDFLIDRYFDLGDFSILWRFLDNADMVNPFIKYKFMPRAKNMKITKLYDIKLNFV